MSTGRKLGLLGSLYLSQGLPFGFFTQALPVLMRQQGYSLEAISLTTLLALPWALKFLWAPAVDRFGNERFGARKSWIVPIQLTTVVTLAGLAWLSSAAALAVMLAGVLVTNLLAATQDVATDGLAVDMLDTGERGVANGVQVAGYRVGMILGGGALLIVHEHLGWQLTFLSMAAILALATLPVWMHRERPRRTRVSANRARVVAFLTQPGTGRILVLIFAYKCGDAFAAGVLRPFLVDAGLGLADIGWIIGTYGFVAGLLGALAGGALVNVLGRRRALVAFGLFQALAVGGYLVLALATPTYARAAGLCTLEHFAGGTATAALFTCMMDWSSRESSATDYTVQASAVVVATGLGSTLSGLSAGALGYAAHFAVGTSLTLAAVLVVLRTYRAEPSHV